MERITKQRRVITEIFSLEARPLNPLEILALAKELIPHLGIATVYRTIRELEKEGKINSVAIPGKGMYYEIKCPHHHDHFHCQVCEKIYEVECHHDAELSQIEGGFQVDYHEIIYHGICPQCRQKSVEH